MEVWELKLYFHPSAGGLKKKKKKKWVWGWCGGVRPAIIMMWVELVLLILIVEIDTGEASEGRQATKGSAANKHYYCHSSQGWPSMKRMRISEPRLRYHYYCSVVHATRPTLH